MERAEKIGLGVATAGHVLLFGLLSAGFLATPNPLKLNSPPMDVSLVDEVALQSTAPRISTESPPPSVAPEKAPDSTPTSVMPIWTVERKRPGLSARRSAVVAPLLP